MDIYFLIWALVSLVLLTIVFNIERWICNIKYKRLRIGQIFHSSFKGQESFKVKVTAKEDGWVYYSVLGETGGQHDRSISKKYFFKNFTK